MNQDPCHGFRRQLMSALEGRPRPDELRHLSWHEHLLGCAECRDVLEREEALELLLASLPEPNLPPDLTRRVLLRLEQNVEMQSTTSGLDSLLELDGALVPEGLSERVRKGIAREVSLDNVLDKWEEPSVPAGLSARIASGILEKQEAELDSLLNLNTAMKVPAGLSADILRNLDEHRDRRVPRLRLLARVPRFAAAAALLLAMLSAPLWIQDGSGVTPIHEDVASVEIPVLPGVDEVDPSLLAMLDMLEDDELWSEQSDDGALALTDDDDLHFLLAEEMDVDDEMLLSYLSEEDAADLGGPR